ncbi:MAG: hypothetical protein EZS28_030567 [Streblomastix strix]|uniref:Uncharacterized protein n=1 Tax=Streblomastix strix TaxID=222440 RepID=A0A5J4UTB6_9EUKA|nr:MAG: hypothetical protein EZS28_030567 [Streblomastix strix]
MSVCFFRPNEIAEIRLKFSNVDKTENQASLRLAPKQTNAIETYEVYETDNESLSPKLAIYEQIDRLKKQFPKKLKIIGASAYSIRHSATTQLAKLEQTKQLGNQQIIQVVIMKGQTRYLNKEVRQGEKGVTNYYPRLPRRQVVAFFFEFLAASNRPTQRSDSCTRTDRIGATMVSQQRGEIRRQGDNKSFFHLNVPTNEEKVDMVSLKTRADQLQYYMDE